MNAKSITLTLSDDQLNTLRNAVQLDFDVKSDLLLSDQNALEKLKPAGWDALVKDIADQMAEVARVEDLMLALGMEAKESLYYVAEPAPETPPEPVVGPERTTQSEPGSVMEMVMTLFTGPDLQMTRKEIKKALCEAYPHRIGVVRRGIYNALKTSVGNGSLERVIGERGYEEFRLTREVLAVDSEPGPVVKVCAETGLPEAECKTCVGEQEQAEERSEAFEVDPVGNGESNGKLEAGDDGAIEIGRSLREPFTHLDLGSRLDKSIDGTSQINRSNLWIAQWKRVRWVETCGWRQYRRTERFGQKD